MDEGLCAPMCPETRAEKGESLLTAYCTMFGNSTDDESVVYDAVADILHAARLRGMDVPMLTAIFCLIHLEEEIEIERENKT